jgi:hypothetical protein
LLKFFGVFDFYSKKQNCNTSEETNGNCHFFPIAAGKSCPLSYWLVVGICAFHNGVLYLKKFSRGFVVAFGHFPAAVFLYHFSSAQRLSTSLSEYLPAAVG